MKLRMWQVDAFTSRVFSGNPAAVVPLESWLPDQTLRAIAAENNLSETAFLVREPESYRLRWFTPQVEVPLCGHATLATSYVVFRHLEPSLDRVVYQSRSGPLIVERDGDRMVLDFPEYRQEPITPSATLIEAIGLTPLETYLGIKMMAVLPDEAAVRAARPDMAKVKTLPGFGLILTAPGTDCDFVSRYFVPQGGIDEDPVTGAAHCQLIPYWAARLGHNALYARQVSARGGELWVEHRAPRVRMAGHAVQYLEGVIEMEG
ncbi:MAG: PhzF family phenazine biosynthesis protein [Candidatus Eisenbacteria bacterium]